MNALYQYAFGKYIVKMEFNLMCNQLHAVQVPVTRCQQIAGSLIISVKFKTIISEREEELRGRKNSSRFTGTLW